MSNHLPKIVASIAFTETQLTLSLSDNSVDIDLSKYINEAEPVGYTVRFEILQPTRGEIRYDGNLVNTDIDLVIRVNSNITINLSSGYLGPKFNFSVTARNSVGNTTTNSLTLVGIATCQIGLFENTWEMSTDICAECPEVFLLNLN
jgi:hypothetical protein